jgi:hypothetical protein
MYGDRVNIVPRIADPGLSPFPSNKIARTLTSHLIALPSFLRLVLLLLSSSLIVQTRQHPLLSLFSQYGLSNDG